MTLLGDRSATPIQRVRGTNDVLPPADARFRGLEAALRQTFEQFGYQGIQTPILEPLELFLRKSGDEILDLLQALNREHGKTIVMVTHDPHAAARARHTLYLDKGNLVTEPAP